MTKQIDFWNLLKLTQEYISQHYAAVLMDKNKLGQLKAYVDKYLSIFHPPIILDGSMITQIHEKNEV